MNDMDFLLELTISFTRCCMSNNTCMATSAVGAEAGELRVEGGRMSVKLVQRFCNLFRNSISLRKKNYNNK